MQTEFHIQASMFTMPGRTNPPTAADSKHPGSGIKDAYKRLDAAATFQKLTATEYLQPQSVVITNPTS
jgi:hypothetical protein